MRRRGGGGKNGNSETIWPAYGLGVYALFACKIKQCASPLITQGGKAGKAYSQMMPLSIDLSRDEPVTEGSGLGI